MDLREVYEGKISLIEEKTRPGVLGLVEGVFFVANKPSRNSRVYPAELWEKCLKSADVRRLLENRLMLGTVGHDDVDFDALIRDQKVSHVVTDLRLSSDGTGIGRSEILDTPVGRILYSLLKSGSKMAVSSKAVGEYKGTTDEGYFEVDPDQFVLERFDFVVDPGFLDAVPKLKSQYESIVKNDKLQQGVSNMSDVMDNILKEKIMLQTQLNEAMQKIKELEKKDQSNVNNKVNTDIAEKFGVKENKIEEEITKSLKEIERLGIILERHGIPKEKITGSSVSDVLSNIREHFVSLIKKSSDTSKNVIINSISEKYGVKENEIEEEITKSLKELERLGILLERHGVPREKITGDSVSDVISKFNRSIRDILSEKKDEVSLENERLKDLLAEARMREKKIQKLGGLSMIEKALQDSYKFIVSIGNENLKKEISNVALKYGLSKNEAFDLIKKHGKKVHSVLKKIQKPVHDKIVEKVETVNNKTLAAKGFELFS